jgi:preprotein translocase subunit YajC
VPPKTGRSPMEAKVEPLAGALPSIAWRWDPETDILSGSFKGNRKSGGLTGTVELTDAEGSVAVLDVNNGVVCGLDMVVWPEVSTRSDIQVPARLTEGRVVLASGGSRGAVSSVEVDTSLSVETNAAESIFHLLIGPRRSVEVVRAADNFYVEVDQHGGLAGFWMTNVPPFSAFEEE